MSGARKSHACNGQNVERGKKKLIFEDCRYLKGWERRKGIIKAVINKPSQLMKLNYNIWTLPCITLVTNRGSIKI